MNVDRIADRVDDARRRVAPAQAAPTTDVIGTDVAIINIPTFRDIIERFHARGGDAPGRYVVFRDVHGVVRALDEVDLRAAHREAFLVSPDGLPLVWIGRLRGHRSMSRVCGPDMMLQVCEWGLDKGWRHVFYGSTPETLDALRTQLLKQFPGLIIAAAISPPFKKLSAEESEQYVAQIRDAKPHFVWIGLGSPKQDLWMREHAVEIPNALCMGVGAAFEMSAGLVVRAPKWVQRTGLEWAFRLAQEPRRLWKRYMEVLPRFTFVLARQSLGLGVGRAR